MNADFDTIRPFNNDELPQAFAALLREPAFVALMQRLLPQLTIEQLEQQLQTIHSASELQQRIIEPVLTGLEKQQTAGGVTVSGLEADRPNGILVTNHRDIVMDAAFIALLPLRGSKRWCASTSVLWYDADSHRAKCRVCFYSCRNTYAMPSRKNRSVCGLHNAKDAPKIRTTAHKRAF